MQSLLGKRAQVHPQLSTNDKRGQIGKITKADIEADEIKLQFEDGTIGKYEVNDLIFKSEIDAINTAEMDNVCAEIKRHENALNYNPLCDNCGEITNFFITSLWNPTNTTYRVYQCPNCQHYQNGPEIGKLNLNT